MYSVDIHSTKIHIQYKNSYTLLICNLLQFPKFHPIFIPARVPWIPQIYITYRNVGCINPLLYGTYPSLDRFVTCVTPFNAGFYDT